MPQTLFTWNSSENHCTTWLRLWLSRGGSSRRRNAGIFAADAEYSPARNAFALSGASAYTNMQLATWSVFDFDENIHDISVDFLSHKHFTSICQKTNLSNFGRKAGSNV